MKCKWKNPPYFDTKLHVPLSGYWRMLWIVRFQLWFRRAGENLSTLLRLSRSLIKESHNSHRHSNTADRWTLFPVTFDDSMSIRYGMLCHCWTSFQIGVKWENCALPPSSSVHWQRAMTKHFPLAVSNSSSTIAGSPADPEVPNHSDIILWISAKSNPRILFNGKWTLSTSFWFMIESPVVLARFNARFMKLRRLWDFNWLNLWEADISLRSETSIETSICKSSGISSCWESELIDWLALFLVSIFLERINLVAVFLHSGQYKSKLASSSVRQ